VQEGFNAINSGGRSLNNTASSSSTASSSTANTNNRNNLASSYIADHESEHARSTADRDAIVQGLELYNPGVAPSTSLATNSSVSNRTDASTSSSSQNTNTSARNTSLAQQSAQNLDQTIDNNKTTQSTNQTQLAKESSTQSSQTSQQAIQYQQTVAQQKSVDEKLALQKEVTQQQQMQSEIKQMARTSEQQPGQKISETKTTQTASNPTTSTTHNHTDVQGKLNQGQLQQELTKQSALAGMTAASLQQPSPLQKLQMDQQVRIKQQVTQNQQILASQDQKTEKQKKQIPPLNGLFAVGLAKDNLKDSIIKDALQPGQLTPATRQKANMALEQKRQLIDRLNRTSRGPGRRPYVAQRAKGAPPKGATDGEGTLKNRKRRITDWTGNLSLESLKRRARSVRKNRLHIDQATGWMF
jgi:hypothetical protein